MVCFDSMPESILRFHPSAIQDYHEATAKRGCYAKLLEDLVCTAPQCCQNEQSNLDQKLQRWKIRKKKEVILAIDSKVMKNKSNFCRI